MEDEQKHPEGEEHQEAAGGKSAGTPERGPSGRGEISAVALGRMLGLVTSNELQILEGKVDLLTSKVNQLLVKMEKTLSAVTRVPTGADLERIDVQIGTLKAAMLDFVSKHALGNVETPVPPLREVQQESPSEGPADEEEKSAVSRKRVTLSSMNS